MRKWWFLRGPTLGCVISYMAIAPCGAQSEVTLSGFVQSQDGTGLAGVSVQAFRGGRVVTERTGDDGSYRLEIPRGESFDVMYRRSDLDLVVIRELVGTESHVISKVMYSGGRSRSRAATLDTFASYRLLESLRADSRVNVPQEELDRYASRLQRMWLPRNAIAIDPSDQALTEHMEAERTLLVGSLSRNGR